MSERGPPRGARAADRQSRIHARHLMCSGSYGALLSVLRPQILSNTAAMPWPPPMHIVTSA